MRYKVERSTTGLRWVVRDAERRNEVVYHGDAGRCRLWAKRMEVERR